MRDLEALCKYGNRDNAAGKVFCVEYIQEIENLYLSLSKNRNLNSTFFCIKQQRIIDNDNTISFNNKSDQIAPSNLRSPFAKIEVTVSLLEDNRVFVMNKNKNQICWH